MVTQVIFKIDKKLKEQALKKARARGMTLSDLYKYTTRSFVEGRLDVDVIGLPEIPNAKTARELRRAMRDVKAGRNFSPAFENTKDAIQYLKRLSGDR